MILINIQATKTIKYDFPQSLIKNLMKFDELPDTDDTFEMYTLQFIIRKGQLTDLTMTIIYIVNVEKGDIHKCWLSVGLKKLTDIFENSLTKFTLRLVAKSPLKAEE